GGDPFAECQRRSGAEAFSARLVIGQNVGNDFGRGRGGDAGHRMRLGGQQFWFGGQSAAGQTSVGSCQIDQANLGVAQDESGPVVIEATGKIEAPVLQ